MVTGVHFEHDDVTVNFMHPHGPASGFRWPQHDDRCRVCVKNVLFKMTHPPVPITNTGRLHTFQSTDLEQVEAALSIWKGV